jgi:type II secretion system protein N
MNARVEAVVEWLRRFEPTPRQRRWAAWAGYPLFALFVALMAFYWSVPRDRVKDRLETALSADVTSGQPLAIGMDVQIGELTMKLFTGLGFRATDIVLRTRPLAAGEKPARYIIDDVRVRLGLFAMMFGRPSYSFVAHALSGSIEGNVAGNSDETHVEVELDKLVLNNVPGIQASTGGLPVDGTVSGKLDVHVLKNLLSNANGNIDVDIEDIVVGDGMAKLTVPNDPFLSAGLTFPRVKLGKLSGQIVIEKGRARFDGVRVHSADGDATLDGYVELRDPIGMSQMHAYLRFRLSEALIKREPTLELMTNALSGTAKRSDGYLGVQLTGTLAALFPLPSKDPPFGVTVQNEPSAAAPTPPPKPAPVAPPAPLPTAQPAIAAPAPPPPPPEPTPAPSGTPSGAPASPPSGVAAPPPSGAPAGTEIGPPPTGGFVAPPPALRSLRQEPAPEAPPPAKAE